MKKAIIIGAGLGGIAAAIRLKNKGVEEVEVFESNNYPGGKLTEIKGNGYRFDAGPSLFTMPEKVNELIQLGNTENVPFEYEQLKETCRYRFSDGTVVNGYADIVKLAKEVEQKIGTPSNALISYLNKSRFKFDATEHLFIDKSLHKTKTYLNFKTLKSIFKIPFLDTSKSLNSVNESFFKEEKTVQIFNRYATYNGSNPYVAPGVLSLIPHLEMGLGAYFPKGGMASIVNSLYKKAVRMGVNFKFNSPISDIKKDEKIKGVVANGELYPCDILVSNIDIVPFYKHLLKEKTFVKKIEQQERSSSGIIFYWGIKKEFRELILHNIFFAKDYKKEFESIFLKKEVYNDPTIYVNITSKHNKQDAPEGCENWFVMVNTPSNSGQDWNAIVTETRKNIISKLTCEMGVNVEELITFEEVLDPVKIEQKTNSFQGALYGSSSNSKMAAFFRHPNYSKNYDNLYFCGGSVHPGGGIPLVLSSAKIVEGLVK